MRARTILAGTLLPALLVACGGGGGGSGPTSPPPPTTGITFTPTSGASANAITLVAEASGGSALALDVRVTGVANLYGVAFNVTYPNQALQFVGATEGNFLNAAGSVATTFQSTESPAGTIVVGVSRLGAVAGSTGSGVLATLRFNAVANGNGSMSFIRNAGYDANGAPMVLTWSGGTVAVVLH
jgi:hypothetical protein